MRWKVERRHRPRPALLLGRAAAGAVDGGGGGERHGVGLGDQVGQVGEGFRGRAVQQRPVVAEGGGGGGGHEAGGAGCEGRGGGEAGGLPQQHLQDVVDHVPRARAPLRQVVLGQKTKCFACKV